MTVPASGEPALVFLSGERLALLAVVAVLAGAYGLAQRRRRQDAIRFTNVELLAAVAPRHPAWRRHLPAAALLGALTLMVVGFARPAHDVAVPRKEATVVLAVDVSNSMGATDVTPSRLVAAQAAATDFVDGLPGGIRLGLVAFDGTARVLVPPTVDRLAVTDSIGALEVGPGTAAGDAVLASLETIRSAMPALGEASADPESSPARIVVLSDGKTTLGRDLGSAAQTAQELGVPVSTVAFGTDWGTVTIEGQIVPVPPDTEALAALAERTGGEAFTAGTAAELRRVYAGIGTQAAFAPGQQELTATVVGAGFVLAVLAAAGSLLWSNRLV